MTIYSTNLGYQLVLPTHRPYFNVVLFCNVFRDDPDEGHKPQQGNFVHIFSYSFFFTLVHEHCAHP